METKTLTGDIDIIRMCESFLENKYGFPEVLLTNSCTMALEMSSLLADIQPGDEVIMPSYTFVSTANAFALRGAKIIFADSKSNHPNLNESEIEKLITKKTKAIVVVHYAGAAVDMDKIMNIASKNNLLVIEDAAQCIDSFYKGKALGTIGDIGCFSFHETKNIHCGEGGFISINNAVLLNRAEIIRNKGTNRAAFSRGEISKYEWMDIGFSSIPSAIAAGFLYSQLEKIDEVQQKRTELWNQYYDLLKKLEGRGVLLPSVPEYSKHNSHIFYLICNSGEERNNLINYLKDNNIQAVFHYQSLHNSPFNKRYNKTGSLVNAEKLSDSLVRLPLYYDLTLKEVAYICEKVLSFYSK
jgi:dTDP-4-amino-4,6-dideoxygalactose transaminase